MSLDATIVSVVEGQSLRIRHRDGGGHMNLQVLNDPCPTLRGLIGCQIWGGSGEIMFGETKIAERIGHTKIRLVEKKKGDA